VNETKNHPFGFVEFGNGNEPGRISPVIQAFNPEKKVERFFSKTHQIIQSFSAIPRDVCGRGIFSSHQTGETGSSPIPQIFRAHLRTFNGFFYPKSYSQVPKSTSFSNCCNGWLWAGCAFSLPFQ
jgi:hypothetical protein